MKRAMSKMLKPDVIIKFSEAESRKKVEVRNESSLFKTSLEATLGEEIDEKTPDGRNVKVLYFRKLPSS